MGYHLFRSSRPLRIVMLAVPFWVLTRGIMASSTVDVPGSAGKGPDRADLKTCWVTQIEGSGKGEPCFAVQESLRARFTGLVESWRLALPQLEDGVDIRSLEHRDKNRVNLLLAAERSGTTLAGPVSLILEFDREEIPTLVSINGSPSIPPAILIVGMILSLLYTILGLGLFLRMKRDPRLLLHEEGRWSRRQAFLTFHPIALVPCLMLLPGVLIFIARDSSYLLSIAYSTGAGYGRVEGWFLATFVAIYLVSLVCYSLPYVEALRRGPRSVRETAPARFTRKQIAVDVTKLGLLQAVTGFVMWGIAALLARKLNVPMLLSAAIASVIGVGGGQRLYVYWVRRKAVYSLPEDHPAALEAFAAFDQAKASIARKTIAVLPRTHWPAPNAFVMGLGRKRCIVAVTEPLLENLSNDEVAAVMLHEYGHVKESHTALLALFISMMATWQLEFLLRGEEWLRALGMSSSTSIVLVRQLILYGGLFGGLLIPFTLISRWCERRADRFAQKLGRGVPLAAALRKIGLATETPLEWPRWVRIVSTHPSFMERIHALIVEPAAREETQG